MPKRLEQMNVRVHGAVCDIEGAPRRAILRALAEGEPRNSRLCETPLAPRSEEGIFQWVSPRLRLRGELLRCGLTAVPVAKAWPLASQ